MQQRMSSETIQARAMQRSTDEHVHIFAVAGLPGHYVTRSKSDPSERYALVAGADGSIGCSCKGFAYRGSCKHSAGLLKRLARETVLQVRAAQRSPLTAA